MRKGNFKFFQFVQFVQAVRAVQTIQATLAALALVVTASGSAHAAVTEKIDLAAG